MAISILLADDSVPAQNTAKKILTDAGYEVITASNGLEALRKLNEASPALAILDIFMPGYTGLEICQKLRSSPATSALPVILTVGKLEPFRDEDAVKVGANATLVKPFVSDQMLKAIHSLLGAPVPEVKVVQPLQPPPPPASEDEPMFAYAALGQELMDKGNGAYGLPAVAPQGGAENFLFNPDAARTPFSASSVDLISEEKEQAQSLAGSENSPVPPADLELAADTPMAGAKVEAGTLLPKEFNDPLVASAGLDPLFELGQHDTPPNILETSNLEVGELPERLTNPGFTPEPIVEPAVLTASKPEVEEHLSQEELARRKAFEDLFNSSELPPVEEPSAVHAVEPLELLPNISSRTVGTEQPIAADPELEQLDPTRQPAVHPETLEDPYLEKQVSSVEDILPQVASVAGSDVYLENNEGNKAFVSGAPLEELTSFAVPGDGLHPAVTAEEKTASPAGEVHLDPLETAPAKAAEAAKASVPEHSGLAHDLLSKAVEAVESHAGNSSLAAAAAGLAGDAGIAAAAPLLEHLAGALTHHDSAKAESSAEVLHAGAPESPAPLGAIMHPVEELTPLAESAPLEAATQNVAEHATEAVQAREEERQPLATDGPLAAVYELAKHDFTHASKPEEAAAAAPEVAIEASPLEHGAEVVAAESVAESAEPVPEAHEAEAIKIAPHAETVVVAAEPAVDPLSAQESNSSAATDEKHHDATDGATVDHAAEYAEHDNDDATPLEVHSVEAERLQAAVEKVFDRFKPLLVAAIVRELARRD